MCGFATFATLRHGRDGARRMVVSCRGRCPLPGKVVRKEAGSLLGILGARRLVSMWW